MAPIPNGLWQALKDGASAISQLTEGEQVELVSAMSEADNPEALADSLPETERFSSIVKILRSPAGQLFLIALRFVVQLVLNDFDLDSIIDLREAGDETENL